jgi:quercetin dioxygenase-like cupin family protein
MKPYVLIQDLVGTRQELPADSILSQTALKNDDIRVVMFHFAPGQELSEHTAAKPALLYFISGEADLTLGQDDHHAGPGTFVHMEPHLPHSILAKSAVIMLLILLEKAP